MSAFQAIRSVARGGRPRGELLPPCRLEAFGTEFFGEEAVVSCFRRTPFLISDRASVIQTAGHLAVFEDDTAVFADLFDGNVARLWRLGPGSPIVREPALDVPFDTDLRQSRGDVEMRAEDHPALSSQAIPHVHEIGRRLARDWGAEPGPSPYRIRAFLIRAFSQDDVGAALFSLYELGHAPVRTTGFSYAAAVFRTVGDELTSCRIVKDAAGRNAVAARPWTPRVE